jgi:ADP-heptose:LPS heptosyltransferase
VWYLTLPDGTAKSIEPCLVMLEGSKVITIFPGGSIKAKQWGAANFHEVAKRLSSHSFGILLSVIAGTKNRR